MIDSITADDIGNVIGYGLPRGTHKHTTKEGGGRSALGPADVVGVSCGLKFPAHFSPRPRFSIPGSRRVNSS
jgi:hypothetical protein